MNGQRRRARRLAPVAVAALLVGGLAACGDDDDGDEETTGTTAEETTTTAAEGEQAAGDVEAYCEASLAIETVEEPDIDFESLSPEEQAQAARDFTTTALLPLVAEIRDVVPEEITEEGDVLINAVEQIAETGDFSAFETPEVEEASATVHQFDVENCGWGQAEITGVNYAYEGVPETLEAGPTSLDFTVADDAEEPHEMTVFRVNDDFEGSVEELLELPEEEAMQQAEPVGGAFGLPGDSDYVVADLEAGRYALVCFIPVGTSPEEAEGPPPEGEGEESGPPHFTEGMFAEFTVQ